jgi:hypothetical protein
MTAMAKPAIAPGAELDGFTIGECVHQGGMATLWAAKVAAEAACTVTVVRPPRSAVAPADSA